jgi:hypothetical protein
MTDTVIWSPHVPQPLSRVTVELDDVERRRRGTVVLRALAAIPHIVVVFLLAIGTIPVAFIGWCVAVVRRALPAWVRRYIEGYVRYQTRLRAYLYLLTDAYPPFTRRDVDYPVQIDFGPVCTLERSAVLFRAILAIPAAVLSALLRLGAKILVVVAWLVAMVTGKVPRSFYGAFAAMVRFRLRYTSYYLMLTTTYPSRLFGDHTPPAYAESNDASTPRFAWTLTKSARVVLVLFLILGIVVYVGNTARGVIAVEQALRSGPYAQVNRADADLNRAAERFQIAMTSCQLNPSEQCAGAALQEVADAYDRFADEIATIEVPPSASADSAELVSVSREYAADLRTASSGIDASTQTTLERVDQQFQDANNRLLIELWSA